MLKGSAESRSADCYLSCSFSQTAKPAMGREGKAAAAGRQPPAARRTKSGDSISPENGLRSRDHTPAAVSSTGEISTQHLILGTV